MLSHSHVSSASIWSNYIQIQEFLQGKERRTELILSERRLTITCVIQTRTLHSSVTENKSFWQFWGLKPTLLRDISWGGGVITQEQMKVKPWNTQSTKTVAFLQLLCDFWFVFVFFMSIVLKGHSLPSLEPSSHWPINSENSKRPRCSCEVLSMWEGWRGSTCREHNQPDDEMSGHPTRFPDLLLWQIEGE